MIKIATVAIVLVLYITEVHGQQQEKTINNFKHNRNMELKFKEEQQAAFNTIERMVNAFENKDIDGILEAYEPQAVVMFEPQTPVIGHEALGQAFTEFVKMNPKYTFSGHEVYVSGNIATHIAPWSMTGTLPDGTKIEQNGLSVAVLRKQPDGTWLMIQDNPHGQFLLNE